MRALSWQNRGPRPRAARKLTCYALAAAASLVAKDALAEIRYTDLGPNGISIHFGFDIDVDADSFTDFRFEKSEIGSVTCTTTFNEECVARTSQHFYVEAFRASRVLATADGVNALALPAGFKIDVTAQGGRRAELAYAMYTSICCPQLTTYDYGGAFFKKRAYLGLVIDLSDGPHAGWAEVFATAPLNYRGNLGAYIYGYAYETTPGKPIVAGAVPEPPSLVLLAAGAAGLAALRKKRGTQT